MSSTRTYESTYEYARKNVKNLKNSSTAENKVTDALDKENFSNEFQNHSISAVVTNYNGSNKVINCIKALYQQDFNLEKILVIDNGSTDGSPDAIRGNFPNIMIVELGENRGLSKARNLGLRLATTDLILFVDDDVYLAEDCLRRLLEIFYRYEPAVVCPRIVLFPETDIVQADGGASHFMGTLILRHGYRPMKGLNDETMHVDGFLGGCILVHRETMLSVDGFDEDYFFYMEDLELSIRLRSLGHRFFCVPSAVVYHDQGSGTPGLSLRDKGSYPSLRAYLMLRHRLLTIFIHYRIRTLAVLLPAFTIYETASILVALIRGWTAEWARAWFWLIRNAGAIKCRRRRMQRSRLLNDGDLLVGGLLPAAPNFIRSRLECAAFLVLSNMLNSYWRATRRWIG